ncbi:MAG: hypothetical protein ACRYF3_04205 [Janthinobacterium lividum]
MNLTTATPAEIDTAWTPLMGESARANHLLLQMIAHDPSNTQIIDAMNERVHDAFTAEAPYLAEWNRRGGWTRYPLAITNSAGHVHGHTSCSTCYPTTQFAYLTDLSGLDATEVVTQIGQDACTVCFPGAPVTPRTVFTDTEKVDRAEKAARAADLAAKKVAAAAKAITNPDGTPLRDGSDGTRGYVVKTEIAARNKAIAGIASAIFYGNHPDGSSWLAFADRAAAAIAAKHGLDATVVLAEFNAKAAKKAARDTKAAEEYSRSLGLI